MTEVSQPEWRYYDIAAEVTRDQVAAALRDAGREVTARELGKSINYVSLRDCTGTCRGLHRTGRRLDAHYGEGLDVTGYRGMLGGTVSRHLTVLAKRGSAVRVKIGRSVYWSWAGEPIDMAGVEDPNTEAAEAIVLRLLIEECRDQGIEVEWESEPIRSTKGECFAAALSQEENGPLKYFRIELWESAPAGAALEAMREAIKLVEEPGPRFDKPGSYGYCIGSPVTVGAEV